MTVASGFVMSLQEVVRTLTSPDRQFTLIVRDFTIRSGEVLAVCGESGSGKSTLLEVLSLAARPDEAAAFRIAAGGAQVDLGGRQPDDAELAALRRRHFAFVLQSAALLPFLSVRRNIALAQEITGRPEPRLAERLADRLGIGALLDAKPRALSIGQKQRAAVVRALAARSDVVFADEPTAALDPDNKRRVLDAFLDLAGELGTAVVLATHDRSLIDRAGVRALPLRLDRGTAAAGTVRAEISREGGFLRGAA